MARVKLSVVTQFYRNSQMLARQLRVWRDEWPDSLKQNVEIIVIDDGSPEPALDVIAPLLHGGLSLLPPLSLYRVTVDLPWNQAGARNLGLHVAAGRWVLMTDMDHVVAGDVLGHVLARVETAHKRTAFMFERRDAPVGDWRSGDWPTMPHTLNDRGERKPHPNSYCMPRKLFWKVGGYDESYVSVYGTDRLFRERLFKQAVRVDLPVPLIRVARNVIPDASTTTLPRKEGRDAGIKKRIAAEKAARGEAGVVKTLQFPWERIL